MTEKSRLVDREARLCMTRQVNTMMGRSSRFVRHLKVAPPGRLCLVIIHTVSLAHSATEVVGGCDT